MSEFYQGIDGVVGYQRGPRIDSRMQTGGENNHLPKRKPKRKLRLLLIGLALLFLGGGAAAAYVASRLNPVFTKPQRSLLGQVGGIFLGQVQQTKLDGESDGQINVLLLGIGGEQHDGGYLSDSIILAQIRPQDGEVALVSLPRDLMIRNLPGLEGRRINAALAEGFLKNRNWDEGIEKAISAVEGISGMNIPYAVVLDFQGFVKLIDENGGVDVEVARKFTDATFPDGKFGYLPPVTFEAGWQHMDGKRALIYARSRHAGGDEGSDFARSRRQQQIIKAAKDKLTKDGNLWNLQKINRILTLVAEHVHTNLNPEDLLRLYQISGKISSSSLVSVSLNPETGLICPLISKETGAYLLDFCPGKTAQDMRAFFQNTFTAAKVEQEEPRLLLASVNALGPSAKNLRLAMTNVGVEVTVMNYNDITPTQAIFYQLNPKPATAAWLQSELKAKEVVLPPPGLKQDKEKYDIIVVMQDTRKADAGIFERQKAANPPPSPSNADRKATEEAEEKVSPTTDGVEE